MDPASEAWYPWSFLAWSSPTWRFWINPRVDPPVPRVSALWPHLPKLLWFPWYVDQWIYGSFPLRFLFFWPLRLKWNDPYFDLYEIFWDSTLKDAMGNSTRVSWLPFVIMIFPFKVSNSYAKDNLTHRVKFIATKKKRNLDINSSDTLRM